MGQTKAQREAKEEAQKRSEAAKAGWAVRRNRQFAQKASKTVGILVQGSKVKVAMNTDRSSDYVVVGEQILPSGVITSQSEKNDQLSLALGASLASLLHRLTEKLGGGVSISNQEDAKEPGFSSLQILGSLQRTQINLETCQNLVDRIDNLQKEML